MKQCVARGQTLFLLLLYHLRRGGSVTHVVYGSGLLELLVSVLFLCLYFGFRRLLVFGSHVLFFGSSQSLPLYPNISFTLHLFTLMNVFLFFDFGCHS